MKKQGNKNQRQSIRIKDRILLSFKEISPEEYKEKIRRYEEGSDDPWMDICHPIFQSDIKGHLKNLREKDKDLAAILEILDHKLNLILGVMANEEFFGQESIPKKIYDVDLSANGIGILCKTALRPKTLLEMTIGLLPEHYFFKCFGKVVRVESRHGKNFIGVKFIWIVEDDREKLIAHIFSRQVIQLRMRRQRRQK